MKKLFTIFITIVALTLVVVPSAQAAYLKYKDYYVPGQGTFMNARIGVIKETGYGGRAESSMFNKVYYLYASVSTTKMWHEGFYNRHKYAYASNAVGLNNTFYASAKAGNWSTHGDIITANGVHRFKRYSGDLFYGGAVNTVVSWTF